MPSSRQPAGQPLRPLAELRVGELPLARDDAGLGAEQIHRAMQTAKRGEGNEHPYRLLCGLGTLDRIGLLTVVFGTRLIAQILSGRRSRTIDKRSVGPGADG